MSIQWFPNCYTWIDGQTDADKLTSRLFNVMEAENNVIQISGFTLIIQKLCSHWLSSLQTHLLKDELQYFST
jgi:hypothetical protein